MRLELVAVVSVDAPHIVGLIIEMTRIDVVRSAQVRAPRAMREQAGELGIALCVAAPLESTRRLLRLADIAVCTPAFLSVGAALGACSEPSDTPELHPGERAGQPVNHSNLNRRYP